MSSNRARNWSGRLVAVAAGLIGAAALLLATEGVLAIIGAGATAPRVDPFAGFSSTVPLFDRTVADDGQVVYRISNARSEAATGQPVDQPQRAFTAPKAPGTLRVFVVGGSSAAGVPYGPRAAFSTWLAERFAANLPDLSIEVINAAMAGYATRRIAIVVDEIAGYEPDLLIVYSGHNEFAERRFYAHLLDTPPILFRLREWAAATRLSRTLAAGWPNAAPSAPPVVDFATELDDREMHAVLTERAAGTGYASERERRYTALHYEFNLRNMVRRMREAGAEVMLLTLSQNFTGWHPGASTHRPDLEAEAQREFHRLAGEGARLASQKGDCKDAMRLFASAMAIDSTYAALHFRMAGCSEQLGDFAAAREFYRQASDLDRVPHGAPTAYNEILRGVAENEGTLFVDVAAVLEQASSYGLVGDEWFVDWVHPNIAAHQRIAAAIEEELRRAAWPRGRARWREDTYVAPPPIALHLADPSLRRGERIVRLGSCVLARRRQCAVDELQELLAAEPDNHQLRHYQDTILFDSAHWQSSPAW